MSMRGLLTFDTYGKHGHRRQQQPMRSWTLGLMDLLYVMHANLQAGAHHGPIEDFNNIKDYLDVDDASATIPTRRLSLCSSGGGGHQTGPYGGVQGAVTVLHPSELQGIILGTGITAVAPNDRHIEQPVGYGRLAPQGAPAQHEHFTTNDNLSLEIYANNHRLALFMPDHTHKLHSIKLKLWKEGAPPGNLEIEVRPVHRWWDDELHLPPPGGDYNNVGTASVAAATITHVAEPGDWYTINLVNPGWVYRGMMYAIEMWQAGHVGTAANNYHARYDNAAADHFARATFLNRPVAAAKSFDAGVTYSFDVNQAILFEEWGQSEGELEIGGTSLANLAIANPNGSFDIWRYCENNCGSDIIIREAGLQAWAMHYLNFKMSGSLFLVAHDNVGPVVTLADGELLKVTYTPSIIV